MGIKRFVEEDYNSNVYVKRFRDEDGGNMK